MWLAFLIKSLISLAPVVVFLLVLLHLDSYKLVRFPLVLKCLLAGAVLAMLAYAINGYALNLLKLEFRPYSLYAAPIIEEALKALVIIYLFRSNDIAFPIDAIILGFAVGTGFALFENFYYLQLLSGTGFGTWVTRGLGTAIMHGGTAAILAALSHLLIARRGEPHFLLFAPGVAVAIALHAIFNRFPSEPMVSVIPVLLVMPIAFYLVFRKSEHAIHKWLVADLSTHERLLTQIESGDFNHIVGGAALHRMITKIGRPLSEQIIAYVHLHTELVVSADTLFLARERDGHAHAGSEIHGKFVELHALERQIGHTILVSLKPHLHFTRLELWELHQFEASAPHSPSRSRA